MEKCASTGIAAIAELGFECLDARFEAGSRGRQPLLEDGLELLKTLVAEHLGEADEARGMKAAGAGDGIHRLDRDIIGVLREIDRDALIGSVHILVALVDDADQLFVVLWHVFDSQWSG